MSVRKVRQFMAVDGHRVSILTKKFELVDSVANIIKKHTPHIFYTKLFHACVEKAGEKECAILVICISCQAEAV
jgi:hypothetical protein